MQKKYKIITYGCQMNVHESEKLAGMLIKNNYFETENAEDADLIILNTCCIRESAETHVLGNLGAIKTIKQSKPSLKVAVCGCMTQAYGNAEKLKKRCPFIDIIFGTHNLYMFSDYLKKLENTNKKSIYIWDKETPIVEDTPIFRTSGVNAWVNIMYGCNNFCSYCIVPYVRGRERSREMCNIVSDVKKLINEGYIQITLLGQNVNSYGNDFADARTNFANLLKELSGIDGNFRIKFMTSHPKDISEDVVKTIAQSNKLAKYVHLPVQSGSDSVLKAMNRKYTAEEYLRKIETIRKYIPDAGISADIMVGFPGETENDIVDTLALVEKVRFNNLFTFIYSKRSGTPADRMENQIDSKTKKERIKRIIDAQFLISSEKAKQAIGNTFNILCEGYNNGIMLGKTTCDKTVSFKSSKDLTGKFVDVTIVKTRNSKLTGEIKE